MRVFTKICKTILCEGLDEDLHTSTETILHEGLDTVENILHCLKMF